MKEKDLQLNDNKLQTIDLVLDNYVNILSNGKLEFKLNLKQSIDNSNIYKEDSLLILLQILSDIINKNLKYENVSSKIFNLIRRVKAYNAENRFDLKYNILFNNQYNSELVILINYVEGKYQERVDNKKVKVYYKVEEFNQKNIKNNLNHLSRNELCYILDLNPDLTFEKEKNLKNRVVDELMNQPFDFTILKDSTADDIKKFLQNPYELKKYPLKYSASYNLKNINPWLYNFQVDKFNSNYSDDFTKREMERFDKTTQRKLNAQKRMEKNKKEIRMRELERIEKNRKKEEKIREFSKKEQEKFDKENVKLLEQMENERNPFLMGRGVLAQNNQKEISNLTGEKERGRRAEKEKSDNLLNNQKQELKEKQRLKKEYYDFINEIKEFNNKPICEWKNLSIDEKYIKLKQFPNNNDSEDIKKFKIYYKNLKYYEIIKNHENEYKQFVALLNIPGMYFNHEKRQSIIKKYLYTYNLLKNIDKIFLKKLYSEIDYLNNFIDDFTDLLNYTTFQKTNNSNKIKKINKRYIDAQISENNDLFEDITDYAKKAAIIMDEKNIKVIAGAGTGKTFTLQSKVKYLIENQKVDPEKVLCLCYTHKSALELDERVNGSLIDSKVEVCTFHEFARRVDRDCGGIKSTNRYLLDEVIRKYIKKIIKNPIKSNQLLEYFTYYINPNDEDDIKTLKEYTNKNKYPTLQQKYYIYGIKEELFSNEEKNETQSKNKFQRAITYYCNFNDKTVKELIDEANTQEDQGIIWEKRKIGVRLRKYYRCLKNAYDNKKALEYFKSVLMLYKYFDIELDALSKNIDKDINYSEIIEYSDSLSHEEIESLYYENNDETLQGERVRSLGEFIIANYLFMHNINYEYEKRYERNHFSKFIQDRFLYSGNYFCLKEFSEISKKDIVEHFIRFERRKAAYKPDFYLSDYNIYLEHFGINENGEATWLKGEEKEEYERLVKSKRIWHNIYGTKLIETYSYYVRNNTLINKLEELLKKNNVKIGKRNPNEILEILLINNKVGVYNRFSKLIKNFINIFEANHFPKRKLKEFLKENENELDLYTRKRQEIFLNIVSEIYNEYYELNQSNDIDHNREISNALDLIKNKKYKRKFDYILIDEYQDINYIRCELIQELQKNSNAKVFVVGDDWQSIYGFSGSNVDLFIDFDKYFPNSEQISLSETRRNSQKISDIAKKFIRKNKRQEPKDLKYVGKNTHSNPVRLVNYTENNYSKALCLDGIMGDIIENNHKNSLQILILGRMNEDIEGFINNRFFKEKPHPKFRKIIYSKDKTLDITFMSIHQSKGLEYDEVIVLNLEDGITGFPSQIVDDPILKFVKKEHEAFPFAEERRLLYVALTRTKHNVYLVYPDYNPSVFIKELKRDFKLQNYSLKRRYNLTKELFEDDDFFKHKEVIPTKLPCPGCDDGKIAIIILYNRYKAGKNSVFVGCSNYCKNYIGGPYLASIEDMKYIEKCPDPNCNGILVRSGDILKCSMNYHGGCMETKELKLDEEDLKYKDYEE